MHNSGMTGRYVEVRFIATNRSIAALSSEFKKIAFIDKFHPTDYEPQPGEEWQCIVRGDSNRQNPKKGALFIQPIKKLEEQLVWSVEDQPEIKVLTFYKPMVICRVMLGKRERGSQKWFPSRPSDINSDWPGWVKDDVAERLRLFQKAEDRVSREASRAQLAYHKRFAKLKGGVIVSVDRIEHKSTVLTVRKSRHASSYDVFDQESNIGSFDWYSGVSIAEFPFAVQGLHIYLSDGREVILHDRDFCVIEKWVNNKPVKRRVFWTATNLIVTRKRPEDVSTFVDLKDETINSVAGEALTKSSTNLAETMTRTLSWKEAIDLRSGDFLYEQFPFQWIGQWLTDGEVWFPRKRPTKGEWHQYPIPAVPEDCWEMFLEGLRGKFLNELVPFRQEVIAKRERRQAALTQRQQQIGVIVRGQLWGGTTDCTRVSVGRNMIFSVRRTCGESVYVVDNAGVGAIYLFDTYEQARALASGSTSRTAAIKGGAKRIIHRKGWQSRLAELIS